MSFGVVSDAQFMGEDMMSSLLGTLDGMGERIRVVEQHVGVVEIDDFRTQTEVPETTEA